MLGYSTINNKLRSTRTTTQHTLAINSLLRASRNSWTKDHTYSDLPQDSNIDDVRRCGVHMWRPCLVLGCQQPPYRPQQVKPMRYWRAGLLVCSCHCVITLPPGQEGRCLQQRQSKHTCTEVGCKLDDVVCATTYLRSAYVSFAT